MYITLENSALILIEFQYEWLNEQGKLYSLMTDKEHFLGSLKKAAQVLQAARLHGLPIIHSGLAFSANYKELGDAKSGLRAAIKQHQTFLANTCHSQFIAPFVPLANEFIVSGRVGSSAFAGSNLDIFLKNKNIKTLYLMGYALQVCVESTLRAAHDLGYEVVIIEDATAAFNQAQKDYVINNIVPHFGSNMTAHDLLNIMQ